MINRFVSMCDFYIPFVAELNKYNLDASTHHRALVSFIPKRKHYFKYIKKAKDADKNSLNNIMKYFDVGKKDAEEYFMIFSKTEIDQLNKKFDTLRGY